MSNKQVVGGASATADALKETSEVLADIVKKAGNGTFTIGELKRFAKRENPFSPARISKKLRSEWEAFYRDMGLDVDLSGVAVPDNPGGFDRVIIVAEGLTIEKVIAACRKYFKVWVYREDLDKAITENERTPANGSYAIRVRERVEADEELKNLSGEDVKARAIATETLLERLLHELKYFRETGKHLDVSNVTLASGSRYSVGYVPGVDWDSYYGKLCVYGCSPSHRGGLLRSRAVVS